ncbi:Cupin domain protein [Solimonas aquatica]|uniref:Cupin domain protein n=1 Tax=Solimonas aquatica TaxID=489703 RepID=A0A1H9HDY9_9GAMM|nr:cupin domain-containing protein [Solimonas aquatica]SEQ60416.1 Cupin domain protein [Solimonas aquatica]
MRGNVKRAVAMLLLGLSLGSLAQAAEELVPGSGVQIKPLLREPFAGDAKQQVLMIRAEFAPGAATSRHTHFGDEYAAVLQGSLELRSGDQPPRLIHAGESYHNARGVVHETRNTSGEPAVVISTFIVDADKPLLQPAP